MQLKLSIMILEEGTMHILRERMDYDFQRYQAFNDERNHSFFWWHGHLLIVKIRKITMNWHAITNFANDGEEVGESSLGEKQGKYASKAV